MGNMGKITKQKKQKANRLSSCAMILGSTTSLINVLILSIGSTDSRRMIPQNSTFHWISYKKIVSNLYFLYDTYYVLHTH